MKTLTTIILLAGALVLAGCASTGSIWTKLNPLNWGSSAGRAAAKVEDKAKKEENLEDKTVHNAQVEVAKTGEALKAAQKENPGSRAVNLAARFNGNALSLLNQREPLDFATSQGLTELVAGLLSDQVEARVAAEKKQAAAEGANASLSTELSTVRGELKAARDAAAAEAAKNLALSQQLHDEQLMKYGGLALSAVLGVAAFAYRMNLGNLQTGVGNALGVLKTRYGASDEDVLAVQHEIDTLTGKATQQSIFNAAAKVIATKTS